MWDIDKEYISIYSISRERDIYFISGCLAISFVAHVEGAAVSSSSPSSSSKIKEAGQVLLHKDEEAEAEDVTT